MPFIHMGGYPEVDFGFIKLWDFDKKGDEYIPNSQLKLRITELLSIYQNRNLPVRGAGMFFVQPGQLNDLDYEIRNNIKDAQLILFLSFLSENNTTSKDSNTMYNMATSENFMTIYQGTDLTSDFMAENAGVILPTQIGEQIGFTKYNTSAYLPHSFRFKIDEQLFRALLDLRAKKPGIFKKIINATSIFFESYYNTEALSINARILLQMSAFEILLNLDPDNISERKDFKDKIEKITIVPGEKNNLLNYYETKSGKKVREARSLKGIWADKFYTLRNHIVHGHTPQYDEFVFRGKQSHIDITLLFFIVCIQEIIQKSLRRLFKDEYEIIWRKWHNDNFDRDMEEFVYTLSWRRLHERIIKKIEKKRNG